MVKNIQSKSKLGMYGHFKQKFSPESYSMFCFVYVEAKDLKLHS